VSASLEEYLSVREQLEKAVLSRATSVDGRRFIFQTSLHELDLEVGGYVALDDRGARRLGQILSLDLQWETATAPGLPEVRIRVGKGEGVVLDADNLPFHDAAIHVAQPDEVRSWLDHRGLERTTLEIGSMASVPGVPIALDAAGFGRHTFVCGQSGSGKTYSLGVLLERLLLETRLRLVVLDPNSDFVHLGEMRENADAKTAERFSEFSNSVKARSANGAEPIVLRFRDLSSAQQAALLRLDPLADREEYAELLELLEDERVQTLADFERIESKALKLRARNLGVDRWAIWPRGEGRSLLEELEPGGPRCTVVDLGSLASAQEQALTAGGVIEGLWRRRASRDPIAIVIDEAHNICPAEPGDPITALATDSAIRIAAEGRKFGLYLIVVTQRPQKVHENVLSQCDNLILMRMNSMADLNQIRRLFSSVPSGLIDRAATFGLGEALIAGKITSHPTLVHFGARMSREGGTDVGGWT
jgi:DNA helicase HerA-like ATPase